jgi:hypothetical protein
LLISYEDNVPETSLSIHIASPDVLVDVIGSRTTVVEVAQIFAWLGAAMRSSSTQKIEYSEVNLDSVGGNTTGRFEMRFATLPLMESKKSCWYPLFTNPVIARSFPIPLRENNEVGLELPLELMAVLAGVRYAVEYDGGLLLKGPASLCVPVKRQGDSIQ